MPGAVEKYRGQVEAQEEPWQYLQDSDAPQVKGESKTRRNIRRRNRAAELEARQIRARDERDESGYLKMSRLAWCGSSRFGGGSVEVVGAGDRARVSHLDYCNHILTCPVCSEIIRRARAKEIELGIKTHEAQGGGVLLMTVTMRHHKGQRLADLMRVQKRALELARNRQAWRRAMKAVGKIGHIVAFEVTYGDQSGWHPHRHFALLTDHVLADWEVEELSSTLKAAWVGAVRSAGGDANEENGLDVQRAESAEAVGRYIAKELTNAGDTKEGNASRTPFQLLDGDGEEDGGLWTEYTDAVKSVGVRAIYWTPGLKKRLGVVERSDEEITESYDEAEAEEETLAHIGSEVWNEAHSDGALIEQVVGAVAAGDYGHAAALLGCSWYMHQVKDRNGKSVRVPMFTRWTDGPGEDGGRAAE